MSEYKEVLHKWALKFIKEHRPSADPVKIVNVRFQEHEESGYCHTCYDPAYTSIEIDYFDSNDFLRSFYETAYGSEDFKMGNILQQLFEIAEEEDNN